MTQNMKSPSEFFKPIMSFETSASENIQQTQPVSFKLFQIDASRPAQVIPKKFKSISELTTKFANSPERIAALEFARKSVIGDLYQEDGNTVKTYRLKQGISQAQLAEAIGTSQPHIARIERGTENITLDTCRRIAGVLKIDLNTLDDAIRTQQTLFEKNKLK